MKTRILKVLILMGCIFFALPCRGDDKPQAPAQTIPTKQELLYHQAYLEEHRKWINAQHRLLQFDDDATLNELGKVRVQLKEIWDKEPKEKEGDKKDSIKDHPQSGR